MRLNALHRHFARLYERRNRIYFPSCHLRINLLSVGIGDLQVAVTNRFGKGCQACGNIDACLCAPSNFTSLDWGNVNPQTADMTQGVVENRTMLLKGNPKAVYELIQHLDPTKRDDYDVTVEDEPSGST